MEVRVPDAAEVGVVGDALRLARLHQGDGFYLVAWHRDEPAGHLHLALTDPPELQDVHAAKNHRRRGVATVLISRLRVKRDPRGPVRARLRERGERAGQSLYRKCGYADSGLAPRYVKGTVTIRTGPIEVVGEVAPNGVARRWSGGDCRCL